ncbi:transposase [Streptomyces sp. NPDC096097]|uniref:transposase n=1 Tax=Streptomyces sp. NPDC096097 TaxID=3155546 RepID=UPI00332CC8B6
MGCGESGSRPQNRRPPPADGTDLRHHPGQPHRGHRQPGPVRPPLPRPRHRWVVERTVSWLAGCRRLHRRYERKAEHFLGFVGIAATLICHCRATN